MNKAKCAAFFKKHKIAVIIVSIVAAMAVLWSCLGALIFTRFSEGVVPTDDDLKAAVPYERVLIFGVDGAGNYFPQVNTPNIDRIFAEGSINYKAWSQFPSTSAHNWTSMMHGVRYQTHGVNNGVAAKKKYSKPKYPSIFKVCAEKYPDAKMISATAWLPINYGIIEDMDNIIKFSGPEKHPDDKMLTAEDERMKNSFIGEIEKGTDPKIGFMYFAQVDEFGHAKGRKSNEYWQSIERVDGYIGEVYDEYVKKGWDKDTLFLLVTDHGHLSIGGHGGNTKTERTTTIAVAGAKGNIIKGQPTGKAVTQDVASIVLYGLGLKQPATWESKVPYGVFNTLPTAKQ